VRMSYRFVPRLERHPSAAGEIDATRDASPSSSRKPAVAVESAKTASKATADLVTARTRLDQSTLLVRAVMQ